MKVRGMDKEWGEDQKVGYGQSGVRIKEWGTDKDWCTGKEWGADERVVYGQRFGYWQKNAVGLQTKNLI